MITLSFTYHLPTSPLLRCQEICHFRTHPRNLGLAFFLVHFIALCVAGQLPNTFKVTCALLRGTTAVYADPHDANMLVMMPYGIIGIYSDALTAMATFRCVGVAWSGAASSVCGGASCGAELRDRGGGRGRGLYGLRCSVADGPAVGLQENGWQATLFGKSAVKEPFFKISSECSS